MSSASQYCEIWLASDWVTSRSRRYSSSSLTLGNPVRTYLSMALSISSSELKASEVVILS